MNQFIALLLALIMVVTGAGAALFRPAAQVQAPQPKAAAVETAPVEAVPALPAEKVGLPEVGQTVYGFTVKEIRPFAELGADVVVFEHDKTGAGFVYIANDDTNRVYDLTFLTDAVNDMGLPHVFEHSTLGGSRKYPSKSLFFNLSYQTYNTYMNASTYDRMTTYPVASLSEEQLLKYADYYTDSCLFPMIMEDESIFREEAWRYRLESADAELSIEGTVYSEMLGANTLERMARKNAMKAAFPGALIGNDQGGLPAVIPQMTWQDLKDYHDKYYHPSNMVGFLYGEFQDYTAFLKLLDNAISGFEKTEFTREDPDYTPITEPVKVEIAYPVEAGSDTDHTATVYYLIVCPGLEGEEEMTLNTLTDLMVAGASSMSQAVQKALPTAGFSTYIETAGPEPAIVFGAANVNREDADTFKQVIDEQLKLIAENGFEQNFVDSVMAAVSMDMLLMRESDSVGIDLIPNIAYNYSVSGNLFNYQDYVEALKLMDEWNQQGKYKEAVAKWLVGSGTTALSVTYPEPGAKEQLNAAEKERLAQIKASMTEEEIAALVKQTNTEDTADDSTAYVRQLQAVTVATLPEEIKLYDISDTTDEKGIRHMVAQAGVSGIGQANVFLDAAALPQEDIHWFKLLTGLVGMLDTEKYTKEEAAVQSTRYLYSGSIRMSLLKEKETGFHPYLRFTWIARDEDLETGYGLMYDSFFGMKLEDTQKVLEGVQALKSSLRSTIQGSPYNIQLYRAFGAKSPLYRYYNYANYVDYYEFLSRVEEMLASQPEAVTAKLSAVRESLRNSYGAVVAYAGSKESSVLNEQQAEAFLAQLNHEARERAEYDLPAPAKSEALAIESSVQYNGVVADFEALDLDGYNAGMDAVTALVLDKFLYPMLRDQYGAYGVIHGVMEDGGMYVVSYRDPNVLQTFQVYAQLPSLIADLEVDQETLDGYILSSYSAYATSEGELSDATDALLTEMEGDDQEKPLEYMRQLKQVTPDTLEDWAEVYENLMEKGYVSTSGGMSVINQINQNNMESQGQPFYQVVLNPFGAKDTSEVVFTDLPEDSPYYTAVRTLFEGGMTAPKAEDVYGVEDPATVGELAAAMYIALAGGTRDEAQAVQFFAQYGLLAEGSENEPLTRGAVGALLYNLMPLLGAPQEAVDGSEYADFAEGQEGLVWAIANELLPAVEGENGKLLAADTVLTRGEDAQLILNFLQ